MKCVSTFLSPLLISVLVALSLIPHVGGDKSVDVTWVIPSTGQPFPPINATVGTSIVFTWSNTHNVFIHPTGDCTEMGAISVGSTSPATYTLTEADIGVLTFACDVGMHCENGQIINVTVKAKPVGSPLPTPSPTTSSAPQKIASAAAVMATFGSLLAL